MDDKAVVTEKMRFVLDVFNGDGFRFVFVGNASSQEQKAEVNKTSVVFLNIIVGYQLHAWS